jgi:diphthamide synthase (EF-2-diphthine--ammonia ligase)
MKPVVHYDQCFTKPEEGKCMMLSRTWDHPSLQNAGSMVRTSTVVRVGEDGEFETLNSIYRRQHAA